jgi:hypothetical protein
MISKVKQIDLGFYTRNNPDNPWDKTGGGNFSDKTYIFKIMNRSEYNYRRRCRDRQTGFEDEGNGLTKSEKKEYRFYSGTRCLKDYCIVSKVGYFYDFNLIQGLADKPSENWTMTLKSY